MSGPLLDAPLSVATVQAKLRTERFGHDLRCLSVVSSTNDQAREWALENAPEGAVVTAEEQTQGRGREERKWYCPIGKGLLFSVVLRPSCAARNAGQIARVIGIGAAEAIAAQTGLAVRLKPPNDLILDEKKLGGILVESQIRGEKLAHAVAGLGINVNGSPEDYSTEVRHLLITIESAVGAAWPRAPLLGRLLEYLESAWDSFTFYGWKSLSSRWDELAKNPRTDG